MLFGAAADFHDVFVVDGFGGFAGKGYAGGEVGVEGEAEDLDAHVTGDDDLVDGGHAYEVGTQGAEGADLGGGFEAGAEDGEVDALMESEVLRCGFLDGDFAQAGGVGVGHVEEAGSRTLFEGKTRFIRAECGVGSGEVDVVGDGDQGALGVGGVDAAGGVGDDEGGAAEQAEDAGGEGDLGHGIALVGVDSALHDGDRDSGGGAANRSQDELAGVTDYGGEGPVGDVSVGDDGGVLDVVGEVA